MFGYFQFARHPPDQKTFVHTLFWCADALYFGLRRGGRKRGIHRGTFVQKFSYSGP